MEERGERILRYWVSAQVPRPLAASRILYFHRMGSRIRRAGADCQLRVRSGHMHCNNGCHFGPKADIHLLWALAISAEFSPAKIGRTMFRFSMKKSNSARTRGVVFMSRCISK